ncbi:MAG: beta-propeller domain-containing protein [Dehalococcoidia bacterium]
MRDDIEKILDECIDRMSAGESLEACLASYPEHAEEIRPLLLAAGGIRNADMPPVNQQARAAAKLKLNAALVQSREEAGFMQRLPGLFAFQKVRAMAAVSVLLVAVIVGVSVYSVTGGGGTTPGQNVAVSAGVSNFLSQEEFANYILANSQNTGGNYWNGGVGLGLEGEWEDSSMVPAPVWEEKDYSSQTSGDGYNRVSGTNVQVIGIDEPDIVKTDGMNIFFSREEFYYYYYEYESIAGTDIMPPEMNSGIQIVAANPPINMSVLSEIDRNGDLLLYEDTLAVFTWDGIYGYDVSDPQNPVSKWEITLDDYTSVVAARLYQGKIYLVTQTWVYAYDPLPIRPMEVNGQSVELKYTDIYYPVMPVDTDSTLNAMVFDMGSGNLEDTVSFVGASYSSTVYMSGSAIYIGYSYWEDETPFVIDFCRERLQGIVPDSVIARINLLDTYDISDAAKMTEIGVIFEEYLSSLSGDEMAQVQDNIGNAMDDYFAEHMRELEGTGILKISLDSLDVTAAGGVPGTLLNQFSMDEYDGYLRVATTVGGMFGFSGFWVSGGSANDIYVLDGDLNIVGSVMDLGLTEQIYSARFIGDKGYIVTYRQVDPFYVLDLSDPTNPQLKGELKIPGYSSYMHPISGDRMLGIGEEDWQVKISLFDVQNPEQPAELGKYILDDYWSDVLSTHHAFLLDEAHEIFFLPGDDSGYIFSYAGNTLEIVMEVSDIQATRAIYIDDNLYVIGDDKIVVVDELTWQVVNELEF